MLSSAFLLFGSCAAGILLGWVYFRRWRISRPAIGVVNRFDIFFLLVGIILITFLYTLLPAPVTAVLLALGITSVLYSVWEPMFPSRALTWLATFGLVVLDLATAILWRGSALAAAANNLALLIAAAGMANLWAQSGMRLGDLSIFSALLAVYDTLSTLILPTQTSLYWRLVGMPFAPLIAWPSPKGWLAFGLGDLIVMCLYPLVMRKAYGRPAGIAAVLLDMGVVAFLLALSVSGILKIFFPVMALLGPIVVVHYLIYRSKGYQERTMRQYIQEDHPVSLQSHEAR